MPDYQPFDKLHVLGIQKASLLNSSSGDVISVTCVRGLGTGTEMQSLDRTRWRRGRMENNLVTWINNQKYCPP